MGERIPRASRTSSSLRLSQALIDAANSAVAVATATQQQRDSPPPPPGMQGVSADAAARPVPFAAPFGTGVAPLVAPRIQLEPRDSAGDTPRSDSSNLPSERNFGTTGATAYDEKLLLPPEDVGYSWEDDDEDYEDAEAYDTPEYDDEADGPEAAAARAAHSKRARGMFWALGVGADSASGLGGASGGVRGSRNATGTPEGDSARWNSGGTSPSSLKREPSDSARGQALAGQQHAALPQMQSGATHTHTGTRNTQHA
ncbi:hypothetical protein T492DRAFT_863352 [Pavlovales sp. CCMP2436]|nr:hypothetical protein T492DRAFT_863352 [Pavlovales sp. CCMP2436]